MGTDVKSISPPLTTTRKALIYKDFSTSKALHIGPMAAHTVTGLMPPLLFGTVRAVFSPVGFWQINAATNDASLHAVTIEQGGAQANIQRQDGGAKPFTDQRVCDTLRTDTFLAIIQKQAVPTIIVAAAMQQSPGGAVLLVIHARDHDSFSITGSRM